MGTSTAPARVAAVVTVAFGFAAMVGWALGAPPAAINTAICFIAVAIGVLLIEIRRTKSGSARNIAPAGVEVRILAGFAVAISLLVLGGSFTYRTSEQLAVSVRWITHTQEVRTALADIFGSLAGASVVARDYWVTKDHAQLQEYEALVAGARAHEVDLLRLVADSEEQRKNAAQLSRLLERGLGTLAEAMRAYNVYGLAAARAVLSESRAENPVGRVREATAHMDEIERRLMQRREADAARVRVTTLTSMLLTLAAAIGLFIALFRSIHKEMLARRGAEQALRDSDQYNRSIIQSSPDAVAVLTTDAHITQMTPQAMKLMGIDGFAAVAGMDWCSLWSGEDREAAGAAVAAARGGAPGRFSAVTEPHRGPKRWWDVIVMPILASSGEAERLLAVARDITEVKRTENDLIAANRFLDSLIENLPVMVVVKHAATLRFVRVNRMFEELMNIPAGQMLDKTAYELLQPDEANLTQKTDLEALAAGRLVDIPDRSIVTKDGVRILNTKKVPLYDENGAAQFLLAISTDITERKLSEQAIRELNAELLTKAAQLGSTNKELESFSYSVSHDLRAPLRAIDGFAEIIQEDYAGKLDTEAQRYLAVIRENSKRMGMLIDDLLAFSRLGRQPVTTAEVNVQSLVHEVIDELLRSEALRTNGKPAPRIDVGTLPEVRGDRTLLRQVWTNLIENAVKYSSKTPQPHIEVGGAAGEEENLYFVRDNGVGFSMEYAEKLFGVFQRLHRADEFSGTGVGLAIVQRVVTRHGGRVWAEGKINDGALFSFALPRGG